MERLKAYRIEDLLRRVLNNLYVFVGVLTPEGTLIEVNQAPVGPATTIEDAIGRKFWECSWWDGSPPSRSRLHDAVREAAAGRALRFDLDVGIAHGARKWFDFQLAPLRDDRGDVTHLIASAMDISERKRVEEELQGAEERLRALSEATSDALMLHDQAVVLEINDAFSRMTGYARDEVIGRNALEMLVAPEALPQVMQRIRSAEEGPYEVPARRKDGSPFIVEIRAKNVPYRGRLARSTSLHDITARKQGENRLRAAHDTFRHLVENSPFGVYVVDADFRLIEVSAGAQKVFENVRPLIGRDFAEVLRLVWTEPFASQAVARFRHALETGEPYHSPKTLQHRRDIEEVESYDWKIERLTLPDGRFGVVCHFYDLSERQRYEAELRESERRLRAQADQLRHLSEALREADRRKDEFLATLAHELRNPLAPIRNAAALLNVRSSADPATRAAQDIIERQVRHMARLVEDLLDVSRITRGRLELRREPVALAAVIEQAIETSRPHLDHELTVSLPPEPIHLDADPVRLAQVFSNLLSNAAKYTERGGRISVIGEQHGGGHAVVKVKDTGIGISPEHLPRLFQLFAQLSPAIERARDGLGIGLALSRGIVEMHGGTIEARSAGLGQGSEFEVRIPLPAPARPEERSTAVERPRHDLQGRKILVVDDNEDSSQSLAILLRLQGNEVEVAHDGMDAMAKTRTFSPDAVLLDIGLPKMSGYEVCRAIRAAPGGKDIAILALTGWGQEEDRRKSKEAGFDGHLVKPVEIAALMQELEGALRH